MSRQAPKITPEMYANIPALLAEGLDRKQIAERFGVSWNNLQVQCCKRGISLRNPKRSAPIRKIALQDERLPLGYSKLQALQDKAVTLGINEVQLVTRLINLIIKDDLFKAVLDVKEEEAA